MPDDQPDEERVAPADSAPARTEVDKSSEVEMSSEVDKSSEVEKTDRAANDAGEGDDAGEGLRDDDSPVERYADSPGIAAFTEDGDVPEPNEPA